MGTHGRYAILHKIADGGMAEIFLARQSGAEGFSRLMIVKRILPAFSADPHFRNMLVDEAHIAMTLNHSNVVPVVDLGHAEGSYFLVMDLVDGWDLATIHDRARNANFAFPLGIALYIIAEVCRGLAYAHSRKDGDGRPLGIVHRDVSPQNVLVSDHGEVKVTDFGIAKALGKRERTQTGVIKGKLDFMSPEQAMGQPLDAASDIFSTGTMLYVLATGRRPFASPSDFEALLRVQRAEFAPPEQAMPGLAPQVARVIKRAMQHQPGQRYASAEEMMLDLEAVMRDQFGSPGQSQLKRWLADLSARDGALPVSRRPSLAAPDSLSARWFAEGEMLSFDDSSQVSGFGFTDGRAPVVRSATPARTIVPVATTSPTPSPRALTPSRPLTPAQPFAPAPVPAAYGSAPPSSRSPTPAAIPAPSSGPRRLPPPRPHPRRGRTIRAGLMTAVLLGGAGWGATRLLSHEQQNEITQEARSLVRKGVQGVSSVIDKASPPARPEAQAAEEPRAPHRQGAVAPMIDGERDDSHRASKRPSAHHPERVTVTLLSRPPGANVAGAGGPLGTTPLPWSAKVGTEAALTFSKTGYAPVTKQITADGKHASLTVDLVPAKEPSAGRAAAHRR